MATEPCRVCEAVVPFDDTVHMTIHTRSADGVVDYYVCRRCFEDEFEELFDGAAVDDGSGDGGEADDG